MCKSELLGRVGQTSNVDVINSSEADIKTFKDIAKKNDISINTALGRVRYSLNNLRKQMDKSELKNELMEIA